MDYITLPTAYKIINQEGNEAVFEVEKLYPGYGLTIGNALRRVLLSSLPGAAITLVKIKGVDHEFSTIPLVYEDVIEILLNLKQVRLRLFGNEPQKITIKAKGEREVKAKDIEVPSQVEIVNLDAHIATLTDKKSELEMELQVEPGIGYQSVEQRYREKMPIGTIAIDAIFTPVRKINYQIEDMRVGERTDYNRLKIFVETDGTITPEYAFQNAVQLLINQFKALLPAEVSDDSQENKLNQETKETEISSSGFSELELSARTVGALLRAKIINLKDLRSKTKEDLKAVKGLGEKGLKEIETELAKLGIELA